jgi:site-specific DNA-methyltransferase (adenine-specific)
MKQAPRNRILLGDAATVLATLPTGSIDTCVTSPPYFALRDYGVEGQLGLEANVTDWVEGLRAVMTEVARVLRPTGSVWLNVADAYSRGMQYGAPAKSALLGPERLVVALAEDGWIVRNKVAWVKTNPQPTSVGDRLATVYELVILLVRQRDYWFDLDAIRVPHRSRGRQRRRTVATGIPAWAGPLAGTQAGLGGERAFGLPGHPLGKNPGDVWTLATAGYRGAHFATFPPSLIERPIRATCPEAVCTACGQPWKRQRIVAGVVPPVAQNPGRIPMVRMGRGRLVPCGCEARTRPGVVLDPFMGAGTVALVAQRLRRDFLGIELNPEFSRLAKERIAAEAGA